MKKKRFKNPSKNSSKNILKNPSSPKEDQEKVFLEYNIPLQFPEKVLKELDQIPDTVKEEHFQNRKDLRDKNFVTIDGPTAKDFDDAIFVEKQDFGYKLFVAIADVSHYIKKGSALDQEAYSRGNSTYFPNCCIPMLPEKLSNDLCSLNPLQNRLVVVAELDHDFKGNLLDYKIYPSVIQSQKRLTYKEVEDAIDQKNNLENLEFLKEAKDLATILLQQHYKEGALNLDIPETTIVLDEANDVIDFKKETRLFSHQMIEQFMLAANKAVSLFLEKNNYFFMYRVHENPKQEKLQQLEIFSKTLGHLKPLNSRSNIIEFLKKFKGHPKSPILNKLILRSLSQARYSAYNKGHYGLNFTSYTHFTSPIRRYCDLTIHRSIKAALNKEKKSLLNEKEIEEQAVFISEKEQNSVKAERQFMDIKKCRFLSLHIGKNFSGTISSVTSFGIFISLNDFDIEGLIRLKDLPGYWITDDVNLKIVSQRSKYTITFGDEVEIQVANTNPALGWIDFELLTHKGNPLPSSAKVKRNFSKQKKYSRNSSDKKEKFSKRKKDKKGPPSKKNSASKKKKKKPKKKRFKY